MTFWLVFINPVAYAVVDVINILHNAVIMLNTASGIQVKCTKWHNRSFIHSTYVSQNSSMAKLHDFILMKLHDKIASGSFTRTELALFS